MELEPPECTESANGSKVNLQRRLREATDKLSLEKAKVDSDSEELVGAGDGQETPPRERGTRSSTMGPPRQLASPHFSVATPRASRSPSPRETEGTGLATSSSRPDVSIGTPSVMDTRSDEADVQYEWQFEILNNLPRDTAIALVDHLKATERERAKASKYAVELSRSNKELYRQLRRKDSKTSASRGWPCCFFALAGAVALIAVTLACYPQILRQHVLQGLDVARALLSSSEGEPQAQGVVLTPSSSEAGQLQSLSSRGFQQGDRESSMSTSSSVVDTKDGKIKETTVREMMLRETTTREYDPKVVQQLQTENLQMKLQLERLWLDIDDAVHKGQDTVCWKL
eukprot:TRINITY_DN2656_c0_g1_i1.p1 TRINITY_DN2656_c0_g1~~TRINITY_DN2656_c0_g1_i1.p1  ORF type:complete len:354 (+),score=88.02 TRINITY_DN2656_c0_g1_i1:36-1064(+)